MNPCEKSNGWKRTVWWVPLVAAALLVLQGPWTEMTTYQRYDEGYNGVQAVLYGQGHRFFSEMWLDQPPLLFILLNAWFFWFGASLFAGRILVFLLSLLFATLLVDTVRRRAGSAAATLGLLFLVTRSSYVMMSRTMTQEIPAYAFAGLALWLETLYTARPRAGLLRLSACAMALSLHMKLVTAPLIPILAVELFLSGRERSGRPAQGWREAAAWGGMLVLVFAGVGWLTGLDFRQLLRPHVTPLESSLYEDRSGTRYLPIFLLANWIPLVLAAPAFFYALRRRERAFALPFFWLALNMVLINFHKPVWDHYELHIAIPLSWLTGVAAARVVGEFAAAQGVSGISARWVVLAGLAALAAVPSNRVRLREPEWQLQPDALAAVREYAPETRWMAAVECQIYPFLTGTRVIPALATTSFKRRLSGDFDSAAIRRLLEKYRPEQILLDNRYPYPPALGAWLIGHYTARFPGADYIQWVRRDVARPGADWSADPLREIVMSRNDTRLQPLQVAAQWVQRGESQNAKILLQQALDLRSPTLAARRGKAWALLGEILRREGRDAEALECFRKARAAAPAQ